MLCIMLHTHPLRLEPAISFVMKTVLNNYLIAITIFVLFNINIYVFTSMLQAEKHKNIMVHLKQRYLFCA